MSETKKPKFWNPAIEVNTQTPEIVNVDVISSQSRSQQSSRHSTTVPSPNNPQSPKSAESPKVAEQRNPNLPNPADFYKNFQRLFAALQSQNMALPPPPPKQFGFPPLMFPMAADADRLPFMRLLQGINRFPSFPHFPPIPPFQFPHLAMRPPPPPPPMPSATQSAPPPVSTRNPIVASVLGFNPAPSFNVCADCNQHFRTCGDLTQHIRNNHRSSRKRRLEPADDSSDQ